MGPKSKKYKTTDRPSATPIPQSSHMVVRPADLPKNLPNIPLDLQQLMLNVFRDALPLPIDSDLKQTIQDVKGHLYNRDFDSAFGREDFLLAYALRWSASRALAYANIFAEFDVKFRALEAKNITAREQTQQHPKCAKILCIGGGAGAEVVALATLASVHPLSHLSIVAVDVADWSPVLNKLAVTIAMPPVLSQYASAAKKEANRALLDSMRFHVEFKKHDILQYSSEELAHLVADSSLVTIMFTLNELFSTSITKTTGFLLQLTEVMKPESWLLVVDSPGSYSEVTLGKDSEAKQYPMKWLLDHTLQQTAGHDLNGVSKWRKEESDDSRWFRVNPALKYSVDLENMRYQIHIYQRQTGDHNPDRDVC
jgi:25S rRNA (uracil2843-N3)-methyltransferase